MDLTALIMAGGRGSRMGALTDSTPKCCLTVKGKPIIRHIIDKLHASGVAKAIAACHYLPESVRTAVGADADILVEPMPLGTAGAMGLVQPTRPLIVWNGDTLIKGDLAHALEYHRKGRFFATVLTAPHEHRVPWGIVETDYYAEVKEGVLQAASFVEKPTYKYHVLVGVYIFSAFLSLTAEKIDMPNFLNRLCCIENKRIGVYDVDDWIGIDTPEALGRANELGWL